MVRSRAIATLLDRGPVACGLLAISLVGCGPRAENYAFEREAGCERPCEPDAGGDAGPPDAGPPVIPDEPLEAWDTTGAGPLTGIFAIEVRVPVRAVVETETRQLYRLRLVQVEGDVRLRITPCRLVLPSIPSVATLTIPEPLNDVLRSLSLEDQGPFLSAADPAGATLTTPTSWVLLGAELADVASDPLPTPDDLTGAADQDMDGQPGVTVQAETVFCREPQELYAAIRASVRMTTVLSDLDRFEGSVEPTLEQSVLGVSDRCLNAAATLDIEVLEGSAFTAIRVGEAEDYDGNGNVSCPEIDLVRVELFGERWAP